MGSSNVGRGVQGSRLSMVQVLGFLGFEGAALGQTWNSRRYHPKPSAPPTRIRGLERCCSILPDARFLKCRIILMPDPLRELP